MEFLSTIVPVVMLVFVVSSMLAVGLSLTVNEILAPLSRGKLVFLALLANFVLMPLAALVIARVLSLDQPLGIALLLLGAAAGATRPNLCLRYRSALSGHRQTGACRALTAMFFSLARP